MIFRTEDCGPCDVLESTTLKEAAFRAELAGVPVEIVYADSSEGVKLAARHMAVGVPHTVILRDGAAEGFLPDVFDVQAFRKEWLKIRTNDTGSIGWLQDFIERHPEQEARRCELGMNLVFLGRIDEARGLLREIEARPSELQASLVDSLRGTIQTATYLRLRLLASYQMEHGQIADSRGLEEFLTEPEMRRETRYAASRLLLGTYQVKLMAMPPGEDEFDLRARRRRAMGWAWSCAPRPLAADTQSFGFDSANILWNERDLLGAEEVKLALRMGQDLAAAFPDDLKAATPRIRGLWLSGDREKSLAEARALAIRSGSDELLRQLESLAR